MPLSASQRPPSERGHPASPTTKNASASALAMSGMLGFAGAVHFVRPQYFERLIPTALPGTPRQWVLGSGVAELAVAALVAAPRTRRLGGRAATWLFLAVFPGNVKMAWDSRRKSARFRTIAFGRLPLQAGLIAWSESIRNGSRPSP